MRAARKPSAVARELLKNFPKGGKKRRRKKGAARKKGAGNGENGGNDGNTASVKAEVDLAGSEGNGSPSSGKGDKKVADVVDSGDDS
jgi:hypothetical protein